MWKTWVDTDGGLGVWLILVNALLNIRIYHECEGRIEKSVLRIAVWHHETCRVMTNGDPEGRIFLSYPQTNNGFFTCSLLNTAFYVYKGSRSSWMRWDATCYHKVTWPYMWVPIQPMYSLHVTAWVRWEFLSYGKISDMPLRCARTVVINPQGWKNPLVRTLWWVPQAIGRVEFISTAKVTY